MPKTLDRMMARGAALHRAGDLAAREIYEAVLARDPTRADAHQLLGLIAFEAGDIDAARARIGRAIELKPDYADAFANLGAVLLAAQDRPGARAALERAVALDPGHADAWNSLGNLRRIDDDPSRAFAAYTEALASDPDHGAAWTNLGLLCLDLGRMAEAEQALNAALELDPTAPEPRVNLAQLRRRQGRIGAARDLLEAALEHRPDHPEACTGLGHALADFGRPEQALDAFRRAAEGRPCHPAAASNVLSAHQYVPGARAETLCAVHRDWAMRCADPLCPDKPPLPAGPLPAPLVIGLVSSDFRHHPVGMLLLPVLPHLAGPGRRIVLFDNGRVRDSVTERLMAAADARIPVAALNDAEAVSAVRSEGVHVLIDLNGHTAGHRLGLFARKPAPLQLSWLGYVGTTGMQAMDGVIGDLRQIPDGDEKHYCETVVRLDPGYAAFACPIELPPLAPPPRLAGGLPTFGYTNNPAKLNDPLFELFAAVLKAVPDARLLMRFRGLDDAAVSADLRARIARHGVDGDRIVFRGGADYAAFLNGYGEIDVALDPRPYSGGVTTCEALLMGVPVVTWPGSSFAGRHAASWLVRAGAAELIADSAADYVDKAAALIGDPARLSELRSSLRITAVEKLGDGAPVAEALLAAIGRLWTEKARHDGRAEDA